MQSELTLSLELLEHAVDGIRLRLCICNQSDAKLVLPDPNVTGLHIVDKSTLEERNWDKHSLMQGAWGFMIGPGNTTEFDYYLPPFHLVPGDWEGEPAKWDGKTFGDETAFIELPSGSYLVWYQLEVGRDFFDCISNYSLRDLQREANLQEAVAWTGERRSNRLSIVL